jgi:ADP-ribose pyrophosphatase
MKRKITILNRDRAYDGFFKIDRYRLRQEADGVSFDLTRELFERGHAAALLPYDPVLDAVLVVEEFRIGNMAAGLPEGQWFSPG